MFIRLIRRYRSNPTDNQTNIEQFVNGKSIFSCRTLYGEIHNVRESIIFMTKNWSYKISANRTFLLKTRNRKENE